MATSWVWLTAFLALGLGASAVSIWKDRSVGKRTKKDTEEEIDVWGGAAKQEEKKRTDEGVLSEFQKHVRRGGR